MKKGLRARQCSGKTRYLDRRKPIQHIGWVKQNAPINGVLTVYKCEHCGKWHTGHAIGKNYPIGIEETYPA